MRILLSTENFDAFAGMETYTLTVARELMRLGHQVSIYTQLDGGIARHAREHGMRVLGHADLPGEIDAIFAQDAATCHELAARYPDVVRVFVVHSRDHVLNEVPQLPGVCDAVVVMNDRIGNWVRARAWHVPITRLRQPIELSRFRDLRPPRPRPRRVLVTSNYVAGPRGALIGEACRQAGYSVDWIGTTSRPNAFPEQAIAIADIVIGLGRSALEAMAAGRAVYVYGVLGAGGWVTSRSYGQLEADGFAGLTDGRPATLERLTAELRRWQPHMGEANRDLASFNHSVRAHAIELVGLLARLREARASSSGVGVTGVQLSAPLPAEELARLLRIEWQLNAQNTRAKLEASYLRSERDAYKASAEDATGRVAALDFQLRKAHERVAILDEHLADARASVSELESATRELQRRAHRLTRRLLALLDGLRGIRR